MITAEQQRSWAETLMSHTDADKSGQGPGWLIAARTAARQAVAELPVLDRNFAQAPITASLRCS
jgi:hypothetical protein